MEDSTKLYSTQEAAAYLGITISGMWYHIKRRHLVPEKIGKTLVFTRAQLDAFQARRRPAGRPSRVVEVIK